MRSPTPFPGAGAQASLGTIILRDPSRIETLGAEEAAYLDHLLEVSRLEPLVYELAAESGAASAVSPERWSAWRTARILAEARHQAYEEALVEVRSLASALRIPVDLLPEPRLAFEIYPRAGLRPISSLDLVVARDRERELSRGLRRLRFFPTEDFGLAPRSGEERCTVLERDGVLVRLIQGEPRETSSNPNARPRTDLEGLAVWIARELELRSYIHALQLLRDLHEILRRPGLEVSALLLRTQEAEAVESLQIAVGVVRRLLGSEIPPGLEEELGNRSRLGAARVKSITKLAARAAIHHPASTRHAETVRRVWRGAFTPRSTVPAASAR